MIGFGKEDAMNTTCLHLQILTFNWHAPISPYSLSFTDGTNTDTNILFRYL